MGAMSVLSQMGWRQARPIGHMYAVLRFNRRATGDTRTVCRTNQSMARSRVRWLAVRRAGTVLRVTPAASTRTPPTSNPAAIQGREGSGAATVMRTATGCDPSAFMAATVQLPPRSGQVSVWAQAQPRGRPRCRPGRARSRERRRPLLRQDYAGVFPVVNGRVAAAGPVGPAGSGPAFQANDPSRASGLVGIASWLRIGWTARAPDIPGPYPGLRRATTWPGLTCTLQLRSGTARRSPWSVRMRWPTSKESTAAQITATARGRHSFLQLRSVSGSRPGMASIPCA